MNWWLPRRYSLEPPALFLGRLGNVESGSSVLIADGAPLTGPVDKRLGSLVSRGRISGPNRKFAVHSPSVPRTFVAAEACAELFALRCRGTLQLYAKRW